jgi:hypothetical protein
MKNSIRVLCVLALVAGTALAQSNHPPSSSSNGDTCVEDAINAWVEQENKKLPDKIKAFFDKASSSGVDPPSSSNHDSVERLMGWASHIFTDGKYAALGTSKCNLSDAKKYAIPDEIKNDPSRPDIWSLSELREMNSNNEKLLMAEYAGKADGRPARSVILYYGNYRGYRKVMHVESVEDGMVSVTPFKLAPKSPVFILTGIKKHPHCPAWQVSLVRDNATTDLMVETEGSFDSLDFEDLDGDGTAELITSRLEPEGLPKAVEGLIPKCKEPGKHRPKTFFHTVTSSVYRWDGQSIQSLGKYYRISWD